MRTRRPLLVLATLAVAACSSDPLTGVRSTAPTTALATAQFSATGASTRAVPSSCPAACERAREHARAQLERAASGLTYLSESDYPFDFVFAAAPRRGALDEALLRAAFGIAAGEPVEVVALDTFFARHIEQVDPADRTARRLVPRYRALKRTLHRLTGATVVYRVGRIAIRCYVVGLDAWGNVFGLATTAIET